MSAVVFLTGDERWLVARFNPALNSSVLSAVPGGLWDTTRNAWKWRTSERTAYDLVAALKRHGGVEPSPGVDELRRNAVVRRSAQRHKTDDDVPPIDLPLHGAPEWWEHQRRAFHFARNLNAAGIYIGMGGGKSRVVVDLVRDAGDQRVLIICPKNVIGVWPKQFELYAPGEYRMSTPRKGTVTKRANEIERDLGHVEASGQSLVVVVNYDSAWREPMARLLKATAWDRIVLDESHRVKSAGGKASRFVGELSRSGKRRMCLTGTPMPHSPLDVYGQYRFLDPGIFGTNFTKFRARYAVMGGYPIADPRTGEMVGSQVVGWVNEEELAERTYSIAYRIAEEELDEILGLEAPVHETREVELSPATMTLYKRLYADFCAEVGAGHVSFDNALVRLLRLAQVTSGHLPVETGNLDAKGEPEIVVEILDTAKADALADWLEDVPPGEPVVVVSRFTHDLNEIERVATTLRRSYAEVSGRRRDGLADDSTLVDGIGVTGVNIRSGGEGVDFSSSRYMVLYSVGFSLGDFLQMLKREHRPGQTRRVMYLHLVATNTVDEQVYTALRERKDVVEYILGLAS